MLLQRCDNRGEELLGDKDAGFRIICECVFEWSRLCFHEGGTGRRACHFKEPTLFILDKVLLNPHSAYSVRPHQAATLEVILFHGSSKITLNSGIFHSSIS